MLIQLAWRNVLRNRRRTGITVLAIVAGMTGLIVFGGFIEFAYVGLRESVIRTQLGHIQITKQGYSAHGLAAPYHYLIDNMAEIERLVRDLPEVQVVTARLTFTGLISNGERTLPGKGTGVIPEREAALSTLETIVAGAPLAHGSTFQGVIGHELAKALGAQPGEYLTILTSTVDGALNGFNFQLVGVGQTDLLEYDSVFVKLPLAEVQSLLNTQGVERLVLLLTRTEQTADVAARLRARFAALHLPLEVQTWDELAHFYRRVVILYDGIFRVIKVIIGCIVFLSIVNTMTMSIAERVREIGTLRALGTKRQGIVQLFLLEGIIIGLVGGVLGVLSGMLAAWIINSSGGIAIPPPPGMSRGYISLILIVPRVLLYAFVSTVLVAGMSSVFPALGAVRLRVVEALRHT